MAYGDAIYIGSDKAPSFAFDDTQLENVVCNNSVDIIGNELSTDVIEISVFYDDSDGRLRKIPYSTPIFYYSGGQFAGKYYFKQIVRTGAGKYSISGTSIVGLIEDEKFYGGMYDSAPLSDVVDDILFGDGVSTEYDFYYMRNDVAHSGVMSNRGVKVFTAPSRFAWNKVRLHLEFEVYEPYYSSDTSMSSSGSIVGEYTNSSGTSTYYGVIVGNERDGVGETSRWTCKVVYGLGEFVIDPGVSVGNGSNYVIDVDPVGGKIVADVEYITADETSVTGRYHFEAPISVSNWSGDLSYVYGISNRGQDRSIIWKKQIVYDEFGKCIINAGFAEKVDTGKLYVVNAADGSRYNWSSADTGVPRYYNAYGDKLVTARDLEKYSLFTSMGAIEYVNGANEISVSGWIPVCTKRDALHYLLFAYNVCMIKSMSGGIVILQLSNGEAGSIVDEKIYNEGNNTHISQAKRVSLEENHYSSVGLESEVIYDNSDAALLEGKHIVEFKSVPIYGAITASGITVDSYNCNAAVVSGRGTITGTPYKTSTVSLQYLNEAVNSGPEVNVSGVGIITDVNADLVMRKLRAYYCADIERITNGVIYDAQRCGLVYSFNNPFDELISAFLVKCAIRKSEITKANCEFISGYIPPRGSGYTSFAVVPWGSTWTIPEELRTEGATIRINIIGKGARGSDGEDGENGEEASVDASPYPGGAGGAGGAGGEGGAGGLVLSVPYTVSDETEIRVYNEYQTSNTIASVRRNSSVVVDYSSASGISLEGGFVNALTGVAYALPGEKGIDGGRGGDGGSAYDRWSYKIVDPQDGQNVLDRIGGATNSAVVVSADGWRYEIISYGGGGGASATANGYSANAQLDYYGNISYTRGGTGGSGGEALSPVLSNTYGCGGRGGNGGGGGGGAGTKYIYLVSDNREIVTSMNFGYGNVGGRGAAGIDGCAIIYY